MQKSIVYAGFFSLNGPAFGTVCSKAMVSPCMENQKNYLIENLNKGYYW
jgi:hypothetical protein